jgi:Tfp pilus assembly protein PilF/TolB-like protein
VVARRTLALGAAVLLVVVVALVVVRADRMPEEVAVPTTVRSLAVAPMLDSADTANRWLTLGVASEVGRALRSVPGLRVVKEPSTARLTPRRLRELLNVGAVLQMRFHLDSTALRVGVTLIDEKDSTLLKTDYRLSSGSVIEAENRIATDVSTVLRAELGGLRKVAVRVAGTRNESAHEQFLRAMHSESLGTADSYARASAALENAVRIDSAYADAWAAWAAWYAAHGDRTKAIMYARRAIAIDSGRAEPHVVLGDVYWWQRKPRDAEHEYLTAIRRDPTLARARYQYSLMLSELKRRDEAVRESRRAHELDPLDPEIHANYAHTLQLAGRDAEAKIQADELRRISDILHPRPPAPRKAKTHGKQSSRSRSRAQRR